MGNGNVEVGLSRGGGAGARGHARTRSGKGFFSPFPLEAALTHYQSREHPKTCKFIYKHSRIHSLPQTRMRSPSPLAPEPRSIHILSLSLSIHLHGRYRSRIRSNAVEKPTNTKRDTKTCDGKKPVHKVDYGSPGLVADIQNRHDAPIPVRHARRKARHIARGRRPLSRTPLPCRF